MQVKKVLRTSLLTLGLLGILNSNIYAGETEQTDFIERFYQNIMGRTADSGGMTTWLNTIQNESATKVALGFFKSQEFINKNLTNEQFVDILYQTLFDRQGDTDGRNNWINQLNSGTSQDVVMYGFFNAQEFKNLADRFGVTAIRAEDQLNTGTTGVNGYVNRFYTLVLNRNADTSGFNDWTTQLNSGTKAGGDIAKGFFNSQEYLNRGLDNSTFLDICYKAFFDREADSGGKSDWTTKLSQGYTKDQILDGFIDSQEFINLANNYLIVNRFPTITSYTGAIKWSYDVGNETYIYYSSATLSEDENTIFFGTSKKMHDTQSLNDYLIALNKDGTVKYKYNTQGGEIRSTPVVSNGKVCFIADYGRNASAQIMKNRSDLICINENDGSFAWKNTISTNPRMITSGLSTPVIYNDYIYAFMERIYKFNILDGSVSYASDIIQNYTTGNTMDYYVNPSINNGYMYFILKTKMYKFNLNNDTYITIDLSSDLAEDGVLSTPAFDSQGNIYFGTEYGKVLSYNSEGVKRWEYSLNNSAPWVGPFFRSSPAIDESLKQLYIGIKGNSVSKLLCLNLTTGTKKWEYSVGRDIYSSPTIGKNNRIYFASESRFVYALNYDGSLAWKVGVEEDVTWPSPALSSDGTLYIGGMGNGVSNGKFFAIQTDSMGLKDTYWPKIHNDNQNTGIH